MVYAAHTSRFHWREVGELLNLAVGEWQIARAYSTLRRPPSAVAGEKEKSAEHVELAKAEGRRITDKEVRKVLFDPLADIPEYGS